MKKAQPIPAESAKSGLFSLLLVVFCLYIFPSSNQFLKIVGGPLLLTFTFCFYPEWFRNRGGSLALTFWLMVFVWLCAIVVGIMSFLGVIEL